MMAQQRKKFVTAIVSNKAGEIFDLDGFAAVGMAGLSLLPLTLDDSMNMPFGGELMLMPDRKPLLYNIKSHRIEMLMENPYIPGESIFPVAAFNSPGYVATFVSAFKENKNACFLPRFLTAPSDGTMISSEPPSYVWKEKGAKTCA